MEAPCILEFQKKADRLNIVLVYLPPVLRY